ncbi:LysR family transcriptional regulator [Paenibacillus pedocola]|uniref:LysR family transcriptional regulator n=1 Tax=Paenibacillus pedocola TaxID=3242193 RepID=UPI002877E4B0|nr:LysR family transcriptional regulator [Paenibacillus typhae]
MESSELRIFRAVALEGSITKAALSLGYVQSNVTARIQQLEAELKTPLFYRQRGMILTPAGEMLLTYAGQILHLLDDAGRALSETAGPSGSLALGAYQSISSLHLPEVLAKYHKTYPEVDLSLFTGSTDELLNKVLRYELDGAFVKLQAINDDNIIKELEINEDLVIVARPEYENIESLLTKPFLMNSSGCPNRGQLESWLKFKGVGKVRFMEFNHLDSIIHGVLADLGVSFIPHSAIQNYEEKGLLKSFTVPVQFASTKTIFIRHKASLKTSALSKFIEVIQANTSYHAPLPLEAQWNEVNN